MRKTTISVNRLVIFCLPLLVILSAIAIVKSPVFNEHSSTLSIGVTIDLLLTLPFVYFLAIRKTKIPKTTVFPFLILGIIISTVLLPEENQGLLNLFKTWALPVIELSVISFIIYKVTSVVKSYKRNKTESADFYSVLKTTCNSILPKLPAKLVAFEVAIFYYGLFNWKKTKLNTNEFSYHKNSGTISLLIALILIIIAETIGLHALLSKWSNIAAWILTGLSIYTGFQMLGFLKSLSMRPISIDNTHLHLRYGIMAESRINLKDIISIEASSKSYEDDKMFKKLSFLGELESHNVIITLNKEHTLHGLYGIKKTYTKLALYVDNKTEFIEQLTKP